MIDFLMDHRDQVMFLLRLVVGGIFIYHGWPKFRKPEGMAQGIGWSKTVVLILGAVEMLAGLGIILGVLISWSGIAAALVMIGAVYYKIFKWKITFWSQTNTGWEFDLLLLVCALLIAAQGAGEFSLGN